MPIFAYRCGSCGFEKDVLQKRSDPPLEQCPSCGADAFRKQVSAPAFQLKGSGWYVTDFRDNGKKKGGDAGKPSDAKPAEAPAAGGEASGSSPSAAAGGKAGSGADAPAASKPSEPSSGAKAA